MVILILRWMVHLFFITSFLFWSVKIFRYFFPRFRKPGGAWEEAYQAHHLHWLPSLLCCGLPHPAGEWLDRTWGGTSDQQNPATGAGQLPWDVRHQAGSPRTAGELRWGGLRRVRTHLTGIQHWLILMSLNHMLPFLPCEYCWQEHLNLTLRIIFKNLNYDGSYFTGLVSWRSDIGM